MFGNEHLLVLGLFLNTLSSELVLISFVYRDGNFEVPQGGTDLLQLPEIRTQDRDISRVVVNSLPQKVQDKVTYHLDLDA